MKGQLKKAIFTQNITSKKSISSGPSYRDSNFTLTRTQSITSQDLIYDSPNSCKTSCSSQNDWLDDRRLIKRLDFNGYNCDNDNDNDEYGSQFSLSDILK